MGLEPTRHRHTHLKRACLPIPALPQIAFDCKKDSSTFGGIKSSPILQLFPARGAPSAACMSLKSRSNLDSRTGSVFFVDAARQKHVVGANSVRPWAFGQCAAMARRWMQRKVGGRTMFAPTCSTASNNYYFILPFTLLSSSPSYSLYSSYLLWLLDDEYDE